MNTDFRNVMMQPNDNVSTALTDIPLGSLVSVRCNQQTLEVTAKDTIEFGHKFAVVRITEGSDVVKYGEVIGVAVKTIEAGEHVHIHNVDGKRGRGDITHGKESALGI
ncbi:altronate dehydratase small subunit [Fictibacillus solisalsi]|uniref:Altronate dehydratase small subunit n=1 Tax=Fictibacillus solisalsi TaxID=459525 RepID=A0A1G9Y9R6_9BACL|nr:UxaA family hydrolase [Fictibacillus solisalsi]SDN05777.1 altronate dehydratase small subunit [Fictibacillus solisalsi]